MLHRLRVSSLRLLVLLLCLIGVLDSLLAVRQPYMSLVSRWILSYMLLRVAFRDRLELIPATLIQRQLVRLDAARLGELLRRRVDETRNTRDHLVCPLDVAEESYQSLSCVLGDLDRLWKILLGCGGAPLKRRWPSMLPWDAAGSC